MKREHEYRERERDRERKRERERETETVEWGGRTVVISKKTKKHIRYF